MYIAFNKMACKWYSHAWKCQNTDNYLSPPRVFYFEPHFEICCKEIIMCNMMKWQQSYFFASTKSSRSALATAFRFFFFFLNNINILAALLWFIKSSSRATQKLGWGSMWVNQGSWRLLNATFVENNLAQSLALSILEEDGENFLHVGVRITSVGWGVPAWGSRTLQWKWGELGDWLLVIITERDKGDEN